MLNLGEKVVSIFQNAKDGVFVASPFIKTRPLKKLLSVIPEGIPVDIVVRFLPCDLASGVTDKDILNDTKLRSNTRLYFLPNLHAKIFRIDNIVLVGSANLTAKGLGWANKSNIEILVEPSNKDYRHVIETENKIRSLAFPLTQEIANSITGSITNQVKAINDFDIEFDQIWIPECHRPDILWQIEKYGDALNELSSTVENAKKDLDFLCIPKKLPEDAFKLFVESVFLSSPFYTALSNHLTGKGSTDSEGTKWLEESFESEMSGRSSIDVWKVAKEWLKYFCDKEIRVEPEEERTWFASEINKK